LAGFKYYDGLDVIDRLKIGARVTLALEPDNPYDPNAIVVSFEDKKLGYIPQAKNDLLSQLLYFGYTDILEARISTVNLEASDPERQFRLTVKLKDNRNRA
jgi:hypothetical protein